MTTQKKLAVLDRVTIGLSRIFESFAASVDHEVQDNFYCVLFRARVLDGLIALTDSQILETSVLMRELDDLEICWLVAFYDQSGKLVAAVNGDKQ
jgi:hypothetical protein